jgi:hypothetical protein
MASNNNILLRNISELDQKILDELKVHFGEKTGSQTVIRLVRNYKKLLEKYEIMEKINESLQADNDELRKKINNLRNSLKDLEV